MLRMICRWLISRSIDEDRRLPRWLRHWIDRDAELKQFEIWSRQLGRRLRDDARGWTASRNLSIGQKPPARQRIAVAQPASGRSERKRAWSLLALGTTALAAGAWFAVAQLHSRPDQANQHAPEEHHPSAGTYATAKLTAADREYLATAWKASRTALDRWQKRAWVPSRREDWELPKVSAIVEPIEAAGSTAGRALATLDRGLESEQQQLTSDLKTAFSFFAYRLPASIARLIGWRPAAD